VEVNLEKNFVNMDSETQSASQEATSLENRESCLILEPEELSELEKKHPDLGHILAVWQSTNEVRRLIENGGMDNCTSEEAFEYIWLLHSGNTSAVIANLAFEESHAVRAINQPNNSGLNTIRSVRLINGKDPMLFTIPELGGTKSEIVKAFFDSVDAYRAGNSSAGEVWEKALEFQTWLDFLHIKHDGNGRASEDWMLWLQRVLIKEGKVERSDKVDFFDFDFSVDRFADNKRAFSHNGLRARCGDHAQSTSIDGIPNFLTDEARTLNLQHNQLIYDRLIIMNEFRRSMYQELAQALHYRDSPENFTRFMNENREKVSSFYQTKFKSGYLKVPAKLKQLLQETGNYIHRYLALEEILVPNVLAEVNT